MNLSYVALIGLLFLSWTANAAEKKQYDTVFEVIDQSMTTFDLLPGGELCGPAKMTVGDKVIFSLDKGSCLNNDNIDKAQQSPNGKITIKK